MRRVPVDVPFRDLPQKWRDWVIEGDPGYNKDKAHEWPRAWYGVKGYFRWLESRAYKMHVRVPALALPHLQDLPRLPGRALSARDAALPRSDGLTLADFYRLAGAARRLQFIDSLDGQGTAGRKLPTRWRLALGRSPLPPGLPGRGGLGYLTLDRADPVAFRRRNRTGQPDRLPRLAACQYFVCAGRAERGIASARHGPAGAHCPAIARRRQHGGGGGARGERDARGGSNHRIGTGPRRIRRGGGFSGDLRGNLARREIVDRRLFGGQKAN